MMNAINDECRDYATRANAQKILNKMSDQTIRTLIAVKANGRFVPVAILDSRSLWMAQGLASMGISVIG